MAAVFMSHRLVDEAVVKELATEIEKRGHRVWFCSREIRIGDSIIGRMNEGLTGADYVVTCFSSADWLSPWMATEWMSTLARQLEGDRVKVISALLSGGAPPAVLADKRYVDLSVDWARGVEALCAVLDEDPA